MAGREHYTQEQLKEYFARVSLPESKRIYDVANLSDDEKLAFLTLLHKHQLCKVPWENLTQHYSWHRVVNVKPQHLFRKIVHSPGRGGYCMEANFFYHTVLFSLGFDVRMAGSRIYHGHDTYGGWTHLVNVVTIAGTPYMVDGGFGPQEPIRPIPLEHGLTQPHTEPGQMRVLHESIPQYLDKSQKVWIYQHRFDDTKDWTPMYCFTDLEFTPADVHSMNFQPWLDPQTMFTHKVVAKRFSTDKEPDEQPGSPGEGALEGEIDGCLTVNQDVLKWRRKGKKIFEWRFKTDQERVRAFAQYFGILIADEDREAIKDTASEISGAGLHGDA